MSKRIAFLSDIHFPYHDKKAWPLALAIMQDLNLDEIVLGGDIVDYEPVRRYSTHPAKRLDLAKQLKIAVNELTTLRVQFPYVYIQFMEGNHEWRMERYIHEKAPELHGIDALHVPAQLSLSDLDIVWVPRNTPLHRGKLTIIHGDQISHSSTTPAKSLYSKVSCNMLTGHDHKFDRHIQRVFGQTIHGVWINGCLCNLTPDWLMFPQWHQGFTVIDVCDKGYFNVEQVMFLDRGKKLYAVVHGKEYNG